MGIAWLSGWEPVAGGTTPKPLDQKAVCYWYQAHNWTQKTFPKKTNLTYLRFREKVHKSPKAKPNPRKGKRAQPDDEPVWLWQADNVCGGNIIPLHLPPEFKKISDRMQESLEKEGPSFEAAHSLTLSPTYFTDLKVVCDRLQIKQ